MHTGEEKYQGAKVTAKKEQKLRGTNRVRRTRWLEKEQNEMNKIPSKRYSQSHLNDRQALLTEYAGLVGEYAGLVG